jgi:F-type H+-transporting ATPase subunit delta
MNENAITVRYAKAFFLLAKEKNMLVEVKGDMDIVLNLCMDSSDFQRLLKIPVIKTSGKVSLFNLIFKEKVNEITINFLHLILQNKREAFIPDICRNIITLIRQEKGIKTATVTTAAGLDRSVINKLAGILEKELDSHVELYNRVKPNIIGGMILRIDDKQYDASITKQLRDMKQQLLKVRMI